MSNQMDSKKQELAIQLSGINFGYRKDTPILRDLSMHVKRNSIYGFLGINGAGKSTTIRNILGLLTPDAGSTIILDKYDNPRDIACLDEIGSLVESPSIYLHLSARENLKICTLYRGVKTRRVDEILDLVGLSKTGKMKAKNFSTGMRQRLGLALALLSDPVLLVLDEPSSGLDPHGIIEIRNLLRELKSRGKTILLSSHQLSEIEQVATEVGILHQGQLIFEGSIESLQKIRSEAVEVELEVSDPDGCMIQIASSFTVQSREANRIKVALKDKEELPQLLRKILGSGIDVFDIRLTQAGLEELFVSLTKNENLERSRK